MSDAPVRPPDLRILSMGVGVQYKCPHHADSQWDGMRFIVTLGPDTVTLECGVCGARVVVLANKLAEMPEVTCG
jgi:hypothetical protein